MSRRLCALIAVAVLPLATLTAPAAVAEQAGGPEACAYHADQAGFTGEALVEAIAVGMTESHCRPDATHRDENGQLDQGLYQISSLDGSRNNCYLNPACNAEVAHGMYEAQGERWLPKWKASFGTQRYRDWLPVAREAAKPYLEPRIGRIGVLSGGTLSVKEGDLWSSWTTQAHGVAKFEIDGDRIGV
ncbi:hypothetical protein, partial [Nocardia sp. NRRL S-836]|uniref:hypothetical protein n=1 Tax=Nocardia sp. NRRL S-836 TaxID=1519492 RepID=UPI0006C2F57E